MGLSVLQGLFDTNIGPQFINQDASGLTAASGSTGRDGQPQPATLILCRGQHRMRVGNNVVVEVFGPPDTVAELVGDDTGLAVQTINFGVPALTTLNGVVVSGRIAVAGTRVEMTGGAVRGVAPVTADNGVVRSAVDLSTAGPNPSSVAPGTFLGQNVLFEDNGSAEPGFDLRGGAVRLRFGTIFTCTGCTFRNNAATEGGAIYANDGNTQLSLANTTLVGNNATSFGGAVAVGSGVAGFDNVTAENNSAGSAGGAFHIGRDNGTAQAAFLNGAIRGNTAATGGGVMVQVFGGATGSATASFDGTVLENNSAQDGGGIFAAGTTTWRGGAIRGNTASARGGGAYVRQTLTFTVGVLQRNSAGRTGGGAFHETGSAATYGSVNVGADADVNTTDTFDGDLSTPESFTGSVTLTCGGSGCAPTGA